MTIETKTDHPIETLLHLSTNSCLGATQLNNAGDNMWWGGWDWQSRWIQLGCYIGRTRGLPQRDCSTGMMGGSEKKVRTFSNWECIWQMIHGGIKLVKEHPAGRPALCSSCSKAGHPWDRSPALLQLLYSAFPNFCFLRHFFSVFSCLPFLGKDKSPRATKPSEMDLTCS